MQRDALVKKAADIHHLLKRRLDAWRSSQVDELLYEAERCSQQLPKPHHGKGGDEHTVRVFTRLMLRGQVQSAVCWMTERATNGGILDPPTTVDASGKTVLDMLKGKHPEPKDAAEKAFLHCDELPTHG